jgi:hypothetical protein
MGIAMAGEFMAVGHDIADQPGVPLGDAAQHEESRGGAGGGEQVQHAAGIVLDPWRILAPVLAPDHAGKGRDVIIILDIDR